MSVSIICVYWSTDSPSQDYLFGGNGHFEVWDLDRLFHLALSVDSPIPASGLPASWALMRRGSWISSLWCGRWFTPTPPQQYCLFGRQSSPGCVCWEEAKCSKPVVDGDHHHLLVHQHLRSEKRTIVNPVFIFVWFSAVVGDFVSHQFCPGFCFPDSFHCLKWFLVFPTCTLLQSLFQGHLREPNWYIS